MLCDIFWCTRWRDPVGSSSLLLICFFPEVSLYTKMTSCLLLLLLLLLLLWKRAACCVATADKKNCLSISWWLLCFPWWREEVRVCRSPCQSRTNTRLTCFYSWLWVTHANHNVLRVCENKRIRHCLAAHWDEHHHESVTHQTFSQATSTSSKKATKRGW